MSTEKQRPVDIFGGDKKVRVSEAIFETLIARRHACIVREDGGAVNPEIVENPDNLMRDMLKGLTKEELVNTVELLIDCLSEHELSENQEGILLLYLEGTFGEEIAGQDFFSDKEDQL